MVPPFFSLDGATAQARIHSVYDGDTVTAIFSIPGFAGSPEYRWKCRLTGIDTPEIRDKRPEIKALALKARDRLRELVHEKDVTLRLGNFDKYGRVLAEIFVDGASINDLLVEEEFARRYDGGNREAW